MANPPRTSPGKRLIQFSIAQGNLLSDHTSDFSGGYVSGAALENLFLPTELPIANGDIANWSVVRKFGRHLAVGTTFVPVSVGGIYRTPQPVSATAVRVKIGNANDTAAGLGAREITIQGLNANGEEVTEAIATAGGSPSSNSTNSYIRVYRAYVSASGTYASVTGNSHVADIVIENAAGTEDWLTIDRTDKAKGQSEIGFYSVPKGYEAFITNVYMNVGETAKPASILLMQREGILQAAIPYKAWQVITAVGSLEQSSQFPVGTVFGPYPELTDIGFFTKAAAGTPEVSVSFDLYLHNLNP